MNHLEQVLRKLQKAGLTANPRKCLFGMTEVLYLGQKIGQGQVKPEEMKISAVHCYPKPKTKTDVRSFLGLVGYYRKFIPHFCQYSCTIVRSNEETQSIWVDGEV